MGSRGWRPNRASQSLRASPGRPELKAVVALRTTSSAACLLISNTLKQNNAAARHGRSRAVAKKAGNESRPLSSVIASEAKQSIVLQGKSGLLRRYAPRNDAESRYCAASAASSVGLSVYPFAPAP